MTKNHELINNRPILWSRTTRIFVLVVRVIDDWEHLSVCVTFMLVKFDNRHCDFHHVQFDIYRYIFSSVQKYSEKTTNVNIFTRAFLFGGSMNRIIGYTASIQYVFLRKRDLQNLKAKYTLKKSSCLISWFMWKSIKKCNLPSKLSVFSQNRHKRVSSGETGPLKRPVSI